MSEFNTSPSPCSAAAEKVQAPHIVIVQRLAVFSETGLPNKTYAKIPLENDPTVFDMVRIDSQDFRRWVQYQGQKVYQAIFTAAEIKEAMEITAARAQFGAAAEYTYLRVGGFENKIYLDLADDARRTVVLGSDGRVITTSPPIMFLRRPGMLPLPEPAGPGEGDMLLLRNYVRVEDRHWPLVAAWCCAAFRPRGPHAILANIGSFGDGKSLGCYFIRSVVDPNRAPLRSEPKSERDLIVAANNSAMVGFDNISYLSQSMSDAFCRLATGSGFGRRRHYTEDEEYLAYACRPILINGINDVIVQPDLQSRTLQITLKKLSEQERKDEAELRSQFLKDLPMILAALLDGVCLALKNPNPAIPGGLPRMADFTRFAVAAAPALGLTGEEILNAIRLNARDFAYTVLEQSPLASAIYEAVKNQKQEYLKITATVLIKSLSEYLVGADALKRFPVHPTAFSHQLRKLVPVLERLGISVEIHPRTNTERQITIAPIQSKPAS